MYKIGEFSNICRLTIKTLRLYDKMGLLKPKSVDHFSKYRFYENDQLIIISQIISLKQAGFSLKEILDVIKNNLTDEEISKRLDQKISAIKRDIVEQKNKLNRLKSYMEAWKENKKMTNIIVKNLPEVIVASMRKVIANYDEFNSFFPVMGEIMKGQKVECRTPAYCFSIYHDGEYRDKDIDVEICESVVKAGKDEKGMVYKTMIEVPEAACLFHKGPYSTLGQSYALLIKWIEDNGYKIADNMRESYIDGCWNKDNENDWLTEIQAPIVKK